MSDPRTSEELRSYRIRVRYYAGRRTHYVDVRATSADQAVRKLLKNDKSVVEAQAIGETPV